VPKESSAKGSRMKGPVMNNALAGDDGESWPFHRIGHFLTLGKVAQGDTWVGYVAADLEKDHRDKDFYVWLMLFDATGFTAGEKSGKISNRMALVERLPDPDT